jgi:transcriptional regulator with XRE-family HTH domain
MSLRAVLAKNIRSLRKERGLSQESLADEAGLHRTYIGSVERAERNVSIDSIEKISKALKVSGARLLSEQSK